MPRLLQQLWLAKLGQTCVVTLVAVFCFGACSSPPTPSSRQAPPVTLAIGFPFRTGEDPLRGVGQAARLASLEGLSNESVDGRAAPRLAEGWTESPDGLSWAIKLRPEAVFHDGSTVDSMAVKQSLERFLASNASRLSPGLQAISAIEASEPFLVTIRLKERSSLLLEDLEAPITKTDASGSEIGTGPYVVTSTSPNEVVMTAFPRYYGGTSAVDRLAWRVYPTVRTAWAATMRGEVDFLYEVGPESREFLQSEASIALYSFLRNYVYGVVFNSKRPIFRDPEIRRALNYAVNRTKIVEDAFRGHAIPASGPAWPSHWAYDATTPGYSYDPARAAASLEKALPHPRERPGGAGNLKFVCLIPENFQLWERLALMVQRNLAEIGVSMTLEAVPVNTFNQRISEGAFDAVLMEMISGYSISRPFLFWRSGGSANFSSYHNPSLDAALDDIRHADGDSEFRDAFRRMQQATFDDPPAIFLAWGETARAVSRRFDVVKAPGGDIRMTISDWRLASSPPRVAN